MYYIKFCPALAYRLQRFIYALIFCVCAAAISASTAHAATLVAVPANGEYRVGDTFTVNVYVDPQGETVGSVRGELQYDSQTLIPESIVRSGVQFTDWSITPTFNQETDTIVFSGSSQEGIRTPRTVFIATFTVAEAGPSELTFLNPYIQNLDGNAVNILSDTEGVQVELLGINNSEDSQLRAPNIYSSVFPDEDMWYSSTSGEFVWSVPDSVTATAVTITPDPNDEPQRAAGAVYTPPISRLLITPDTVSSGEQYLSVRHQYNDEWGPTQVRRVLIDQVPPEPFYIEKVPPETSSDDLVLRFHAHDSISGVASYKVQVGDENYLVTPLEAYFGYEVPENNTETDTAIRVVAFDKAGNATEAQNNPLLLSSSNKASVPNNSETISSIIGVAVLAVFCALVTVVVLLVLYYRHQAHLSRRQHELLRKETQEVNVQTKKIFKALRDEIEDQIQTLSSKKRLNKHEQAVVANLSQALTVSEVLLQKEIEDVEELLKQ